MKLKAVLSAIAIAVLIVGAMSYHAISQTSAGKKILYYSCSMHPQIKSDKPGSCSICGMALEPVYGSDSATNAPSSTNSTPSTATNSAAADAKPKPYPLDTCVVSGEKLGGMGAPSVFVYQGQEIKFCCPMCKSRFLNNADAYMKKIQDAETAKK